MAFFALEIVNPRTAGTCQGFAMPRPQGAPLTAPVRPPKRFLLRGRRKQIEVSYYPRTIIGSGSFNGGRSCISQYPSADRRRSRRSIRSTPVFRAALVSSDQRTELCNSVPQEKG